MQAAVYRMNGSCLCSNLTYVQVLWKAGQAGNKTNSFSSAEATLLVTVSCSNRLAQAD